MIDFEGWAEVGNCMIDFEVGRAGWVGERLGRAGGIVGGKVVVGKSYGVEVETPKYLPYPVPTA
jgi:hypothetical protein